MSMLYQNLVLPCGQVFKSRLAKSAMSDVLGDGTGHPSDAQIRLYNAWSQANPGLLVIGEVQSDYRYPECAGNLVLSQKSDLSRFESLAKSVDGSDTKLWLQLGHAGALTKPEFGEAVGPSALDLPGVTCREITEDEIWQSIDNWARTAELAKAAGFSGVELHAGHGFLVSQFLSPLFNKRTDQWGGAIENRSRIILEAVSAIRKSVGNDFAIGLKMNCTDRLEGGLTESEAIEIIPLLDETSLDLIEISGGTYFPGAAAASDAGGKGAYFAEFSKQAKERTSIPVMVTGGIKSKAEADRLLSDGHADMIGCARLFILKPDLPQFWSAEDVAPISFPRFAETKPGAITSWFSFALQDIAKTGNPDVGRPLEEAMEAFAAHENRLLKRWQGEFLNS